ncbi:hypothetical protein [Aquimarina macrocephali]|uniref:hypothetical protein n=1 Tax=Aquimarina macrocephali TaxID=666563 RepID=UPI0013784AB4|nr:hypothetical protein [Aquimarina macrocephali]
METANLKIVYNHKNQKEMNIINQNKNLLLIKRLEMQIRNWYLKLEQLGIGAGAAIRN